MSTRRRTCTSSDQRAGMRLSQLPLTPHPSLVSCGATGPCDINASTPAGIQTRISYLAAETGLVHDGAMQFQMGNAAALMGRARRSDLPLPRRQPSAHHARRTGVLPFPLAAGWRGWRLTDLCSIDVFYCPLTMVGNASVVEIRAAATVLSDACVGVCGR